MVIGELLGDPDPTGGVTPALKGAMVDFESKLRGRIDRGEAPGADLICNTLTGQFAEFRSPERAAFCTRLVTEVAGLVAEALSGQTVSLSVIGVKDAPG